MPGFHSMRISAFTVLAWASSVDATCTTEYHQTHWGAGPSGAYGCHMSGAGMCPSACSYVAGGPSLPNTPKSILDAGTPLEISTVHMSAYSGAYGTATAGRVLIEFAADASGPWTTFALTEIPNDASSDSVCVHGGTSAPTLARWWRVTLQSTYTKLGSSTSKGYAQYGIRFEVFGPGRGDPDAACTNAHTIGNLVASPPPPSPPLPASPPPVVHGAVGETRESRCVLYKHPAHPGTGYEYWREARDGESNSFPCELDGAWTEQLPATA